MNIITAAEIKVGAVGRGERLSVGRGEDRKADP